MTDDAPQNIPQASIPNIKLPNEQLVAFRQVNEIIAARMAPLNSVNPAVWNAIQSLNISPKAAYPPEMQQNIAQIFAQAMATKDAPITSTRGQSRASNKSPYSSNFSSPGDYFRKYERRINSFSSFNEAIGKLTANVGAIRLVWRGQTNAKWGIHSGLYRALLKKNGINLEEDLTKVRGNQPFPTEEQLIAAEQEILKAARTDWRFDGMPALETFARLQHEGGLTRLLDVSKNPYIAAWFAVEDGNNEEEDGRLVAFATTSVNKPDKRDTDDTIVLDGSWDTYRPIWHMWDDSRRKDLDWGTGAKRRVWTPPVYHDRIAAQNAAFLVDGIPRINRKLREGLNRPGKKEVWTRSDILAASSVLAKVVSANKIPRTNKMRLAPTFTFLIEAKAKQEIREHLESQFGYTRSYVYPDMSAFAEYTRKLPLPSLADVESQMNQEV
jgi:FRG domain protein